MKENDQDVNKNYFIKKVMAILDYKVDIIKENYNLNLINLDVINL